MSDATNPTNVLENVDVVICIDTSGTMSEKDVSGSMTRLEAVRENAVALARELEQYDPDGLTVIRFASKVRLYDGVTADKVKQVFQEFRAMGNTNTKEAVEQAISKFLGKRASAGATAKPICIIVFTDGEPDDKVGLATVIVNATKQISDRKELGILFVQVGKDAGAAAYLDKLNNNLTAAGAAHDIVAVTKLDELEEISPAELVEMAFND